MEGREGEWRGKREEGWVLVVVVGLGRARLLGYGVGAVGLWLWDSAALIASSSSSSFLLDELASIATNAELPKSFIKLSYPNV